MGVVEELLASLRGRLDAYLDRGDASAVLADEALMEVDELFPTVRATTDSAGVMLEAVVTVAWLYWCRSLALPGGQGHDDRQAALELFEAIREVDPTLVPDELGAAGDAAGAPDDGPEAWAEQATEILRRTRHVDDPAALGHAIGLLRQALQAVPTDHPDRARWLSTLSIALRFRSWRQGGVTDLDAAVTIGREAVAAVPADHPDRAMFLSALGNALQVRFERLGDLDDLDAAVAIQQEAVEAVPDDDPARATYLSNLGGALQIRFKRLGDLADLDAAITAGREAVTVTPADDPGRAGRLSNLGLALLARFERIGEMADVNAAVMTSREAVAATADDDPERAGFLSNLGGALLARYRRLGNMADLDTAIATDQAAVAATPVGDVNRVVFLSNLGDMLRVRFEDLGDVADLDAAIAAGREAVTVTPADDPRRTGPLHNLCIALRTRFEQTGDVDDINAAVTAGQAAVAARPDDDPKRAGYLSSLSLALLARFEQTGDVDDINAAVSSSQEAVAATPTDHPKRAGELSALGSVLLTRYTRVGDVADLDAAVTSLRAAVAATPSDHPRRDVFLHNLSFALHTRFERDGELADLDAAVTSAREGIAASPAKSSERARYLSGLGTVLATRFERTGDMADINAAITAGQEAVTATPTGHPDRPLYLSMYGLVLHARFKEGGALADLDAAITAGREAVAATPTNHPDRPLYLSNLGAALQDRFEQTGDLADLDAAITAGRGAVRTIRPNHPYRARFLYAFGVVLRARFERVQDLADAHTALRVWREATSVATAPTSVRMEAGRAWGALAASLGRWSDATHGYAQAVGLLPLLAWLGAGRVSRERLLADWGGLAADAAACAVAAGQPDRAVELLEQGRGVLWSQMLETRTDLTALRQAHPDLAAQLDRARIELDRPDVRPTSASTGGRSPASDIDTRIEAARQWQTLLDEIRALPGFQDFARPPTAAQLRRAASTGTVVVVNISRWRCDALLVTDTTIDVTPLPDLTQDAAVDRVNTYLIALQEFQTARRDPNTARRAMEQTITATLEWLWDAVAAPVLDALGHHHTPTSDQQWPRLWWCPTGPLTFVPLHAAGHHDQLDGRSVLDRVVSSYTPTLRAISAARTRPQPTSSGSLLLISLPNTPGAPPLPAVTREQAFLTNLFNDTPHTVLADADATRANILRDLATHPWTHAACHGDQNLADPATGGLLPYDWNSAGLVSVLDLTTADHTGGEFICLSACKSATGGIATLDEAINLAAALHYTGWRHVIGTLWSVWDADTALITQGIYVRLVGDGHFDPTRTAEALHHTLRDYRQRNNHRYQPSRWAPFTHIGP